MLRSNSWDLNSPRQGYQITKRDPQYNSDGKYFKTVDGETVRKLFVGNLPDPVNGVCVAHGLLNDIFRQYGRVVDVSVVHRPHAKPFAFVTFYTPQDAAKAYKRKDTLCILKRKLFLSFADGWHQPLELPDGSIVWDRRKQGTTALVPQEEVVDKVHDLDSEAPVPLIDESLHGPQDDDEEEEEETPDTETSAIDTLNDDCLQLIFDLLPIVDRMALSRVCSRWRSLNSYYWRSFRKLDFTSPLLDRILLTDKTLLYFLHLCPNVTSLNIAQDDNDLSSEAIVIIAKSCKNLKEIHMRNITIKYRSLAYLANCCPKLKAFSMDACTSQHDAEMISLVKKSRNLESITLKYGCGTNGYWLKHLQPPLRKLVLEMYEFDGDNLLEGIKKVNSTLRELSFVSCSELRNRDLQNIINLCPDITKFALSGILQLHEFRSILPITQLSKLENLDLEHNRVVCDKFIDALVEGCPALRQLNLSGIESFDLTERGLFQLVKLTNLTHLRMACIKVTDNLLKALAKKLKLEHLDITGCLNVTDEGCIEILKHCPELESLDLAGCLRVTNETIQAAINVLSNDPTRVKLNIVCGNSGVFDEPWFHESETTKRLNIDLKSTIIANFFEDFYRMDYDDFDPGSEDSYDHDIYDDDDDDPYDIFEGVAFADDYDAYGEIRLRLGPYLAEDYSESDDNSF